jgi:hypothetical protein
MKRVLLLAGLLTALAVVPARAASVDTVSCQHLHLSYSYSPGATSFSVAASASQCTDGSAVAVATSGSGSAAFTTAPLNVPCPRGSGGECLNWTLSLAIGGASAHPSFSTIGADYPSVDTGVAASTFAYGETDTITGFSQGAGAGALNTLCTYVPSVISCTADGSFTWEPQA